ncbi:MAG: hypothetical protein ACLFWR_12365, partial [Acidimicrobiales bacterium]
RVARFATNIAKRLAAFAGPAAVAMERTPINAEPGLVVLFDGQPFLAASFTVVDGRVSRIHLMRNPSKLAALAVEGELT